MSKDATEISIVRYLFQWKNLLVSIVQEATRYFWNWQVDVAGIDKIRGGGREIRGVVRNAKGDERRCEGLENCSSVGKSPTCSSQIFTSILLRLELNLE